MEDKSYVTANDNGESFHTARNMNNKKQSEELQKLPSKRRSIYIFLLMALFATMGGLLTVRYWLMGYSEIEPLVFKMEFPGSYKGFGGIIVYDVNDDGQMDFIISTKGHIFAYDLAGRELWSKKTDIQVSDGDGWLPGSHGAGVQAADIDGNGKTEVLFLTRDNTLHVVEGASGRTIYNVKLPTVPGRDHPWEHLVIANFRGKGDRDLLFQATQETERRDFRIGRYVAAFAIDDLLESTKPNPMWFREDYCGPAHGAARVADIDGDGRDEVIGGTIFSHVGELLYAIPPCENPYDHIDAIHVAHVRPDIPGLQVVALQETHDSDKGGNYVFLYNEKGLIWKTHFYHREPQNAAIGDFDPARPGLEIWCRSRYHKDQKPFVFGADGEIISNYTMADVAPFLWTKRGVEVISPVDWTGNRKQLAVAKERHTSGDVGLFDPISGKFLWRFREAADRLFVADVLGDWREEIIVLAGNHLRVYVNAALNPNPNRPRLWTFNHYQRSKMTWNYYNP